MISYLRHNSVFDLGSRTGTSTCVGLYKELDDIYSKYINPQVRVQYANNGSTTDCLCNMAGKQMLSGDAHAFIFQNGIITVTVDEADNVTVASFDAGGGGHVSSLADLHWVTVYEAEPTAMDVHVFNDVELAAGQSVRITTSSTSGSDITQNYLIFDGSKKQSIDFTSTTSARTRLVDAYNNKLRVSVCKDFYDRTSQEYPNDCIPIKIEVLRVS